MSAYANSTAYQSQQIHTASQEQILIMLYDGAIRFLNTAKIAHEGNNSEKFHHNVVKCQRIIMEFMTTLDIEMGGDIARNLFSLYEYLHYRLVQANLKKDLVMVDEVLGHLRELKNTWEEAIKISRQENGSGAAQPSNVGRTYSA